MLVQKENEIHANKTVKIATTATSRSLSCAVGNVRASDQLAIRVCAATSSARTIRRCFAALRQAVTLNPSDPSPHYQLARAFERMGDKEQAGEEWQRFAEAKKSQRQSGGMATGRVH